MDFPGPGTRVRVLKNDTDEPELVGLEGDLVKETVRRDGKHVWVVFLDDDKMPTSFPPDELAVLGPDGEPLREWAPCAFESRARERLSALADQGVGGATLC